MSPYVLNIFSRIISGEIPCKKVLETPHSLAFHDLHPKAKIHILLIPKGHYSHATDFYGTAGEEEIVDFARAMAKLSHTMDLSQGLRWVTNESIHGHQEIPHFHFHLLGGEDLTHVASL